MKGCWLGLACVLLVAGTCRAEILATARSANGEFPAFRVALDALDQPAAVANFMGLADGTLRWVDPADGRVRGGDGDAFYDGMVFDWNTGNSLRGGLRSVKQSDGSWEYTGGPGYTIVGKTNEAWSAFAEGALALVESEGPHTGGGEIAFALTNTVTAWTVFGRVEEGDVYSLQTLAARVRESGATEVRWEVDVSGMTEAEHAALETARAGLPEAGGIETRFDTGNQLTFDWPGTSQLEITRWTNMTDAADYVAGGWNEGASPRSMTIDWSDVYLTGPKGFLSFSRVRYPVFAANPFTGKWRMLAEHTGQSIQYWFDFDGRTGMMARVESGVITEQATFSQLESWRTAANGITIFYGRGFIANYYHLGFAGSDSRSGRFMSEQKVGESTTDWGTFELAEGWGEEKRRDNSFSFPWLPWSAP